MVSDLPSRIRNNIHFSTSEKMIHVPNDTVQAVICSPPYWNLKDYGHSDQIGYGEGYGEYLRRLGLVWSECKRVLLSTGSIWIVIDKVFNEGEILNIPYDIAVQCKELGFTLQDMIVWNKPTAIAGMNRRNLVNKFEYVLFLSKSPDKFKFLPPGDSGRLSPDFARDSGKLTDLWRIPVKAGSIRKTPEHKAPYPEELIERLVSISTDEGDVVLDPFLGSGTTLKVAIRMNRIGIGYEINTEFDKVIAENLRSLREPGSQMRFTE